MSLLNWIKQTVVDLIDQHGTNNPFEIAEAKKIIVRELPLGDTLGFYMYDRRFQVITLNKSLNEVPHRKMFVMSHELGHATAHPRANTPFLKENTLFSVDKIEVEANTFAVELLLPDSILQDYKDANYSLQEIATIYGIPKQLALLKSLR